MSAGGSRSLIQRGFVAPVQTPDPQNGASGPGPVFDTYGAQFVHVLGEILGANNAGQAGVFNGVVDGIVLSQFNFREMLLATGSMLYATRLAGSNTLDRLNQTGDSTDAQVAQAQGFLGVMSKLQGFNGATWDRIRSGGDNADAVATATLGRLIEIARGSVFNNATWDRMRSGSAANLATLLSLGSLMTVAPGQWSIVHTPATATQATITRAAGGAGVRHVCNAIHARLIIPPTVNQPLIQVNLRDGATGAGTILYSTTVGVGAALANGGEQVISQTGLEIPGTANTAMTLEFSAAGAATTAESVTLTGHDAS